MKVTNWLKQTLGRRHAETELPADDKPVLLVYQMAKVGSTSIVASLKQLPQWRVYHIHQLNSKTLKEFRERFKKRGRRIPLHVKNGQYLLTRYVNRGRPLKMITLVREPISRNFSAFFGGRRFVEDGEPDFEGTPTEVWIRRFINEYPHSLPLTWFDLQVKEPLGIDVYRYPFPHDMGYQIIRENGHEMLLMRCESSNDLKVKAISEFIGTEIGELPILNAGENKQYADAYKKFKETIRLPSEYVEKMCTARYTRHFYTEQEIRQVYETWRARTVSGVS